uniref:Endonuclease/exonuclease/phosphatase domain-containing protein n=1 Tax=Quercus lobata TaxID=97700 RepID=A0A7N2L6U1_QUELO
MTLETRKQGEILDKELAKSSRSIVKPLPQTSQGFDGSELICHWTNRYIGEPQCSVRRVIRNGSPAYNSSNGHIYHSTTINEEGNPNIMEVVERTELNGLDTNDEQYPDINAGQNLEINAEMFINVPIMCVDNGVNAVQSLECETLATLVLDRQARDRTKAKQAKVPKWTKIAREFTASKETENSSRAIGKKHGHGLENLSASTVLSHLAREKAPDVLFLMETKQTVDEMRNIQADLHYDSMLAVPCVHRVGGIAMLWKADVDLHVQTYSLNHIDARIMIDPFSPWRLTGFYGRPEEHRKHKSLEYLRHLHSRDSQPWICMGDYNKILSSDEK